MNEQGGKCTRRAHDKWRGTKAKAKICQRCGLAFLHLSDLDVHRRAGCNQEREP
jgi:hypothetical protein